jgi:hypothetical protein
MRTWSYGLAYASNLLAFHREGGDAVFMCFNTLANKMGQSTLETPLESAPIFTAAGHVAALMAKSPAAWPLKMSSGYNAHQQDTLQVQVALDRSGKNLVVYLLNRGPRGGTVYLNTSALETFLGKLDLVRLSATDGLIVETVKEQGNISKLVIESFSDYSEEVEFSLPPFSFSQAVLSRTSLSVPPIRN